MEKEKFEIIVSSGTGFPMTIHGDFHPEKKTVYFSCEQAESVVSLLNKLTASDYFAFEKVGLQEAK